MPELSYNASPEFEAFVMNQSSDERFECLDPLDILIMLEEQDLYDQ